MTAEFMMFVLLMGLPFTWSELNDMDQPMTSLDAEYSGLVPNVQAWITSKVVTRRRFGQHVGVQVRAETLAEIRTWIMAMDDHHNGGACSINDEENVVLLDEFMNVAMANTSEIGAILFRK